MREMWCEKEEVWCDLESERVGCKWQNNNFSAIVLSLHHDRSLSLSLSLSLLSHITYLSSCMYAGMTTCTDARMYACMLVNVCTYQTRQSTNQDWLYRRLMILNDSTDRGVWLDMAQYNAMYRNKYTNKLVLHQSKCGYIFTGAIKFKWAAVSLMLMSTHPASLKFERRPLAPLSHIY